MEQFVKDNSWTLRYKTRNLTAATKTNIGGFGCIFWNIRAVKIPFCDILVYDNLLKYGRLIQPFQRKCAVPTQGLRRTRQYIFFKLWHSVTRLHDIIIQNTTVKVKIILEHVCCGWRTPPTTHSNQFQLFHDSSRQQYGVTVTRRCSYSCFVLLRMGDGDARNM
jgi:hypothetical protein